MNIRKRLRHTEEIDAGPLNDILFIFLIFFLIVSTLANPNVVKVNNAKGKADTKVKQNVTVSVDKDNNFFVGQRQIAENDLDSLIKFEVEKMRAVVDTPSVVINADTISYSGGLFKVMNAAKRSGAKIVFSVKGN